MKNNFDLTNYMKSNKVGAYQQLNEMWYQNINQALGDFNAINEDAIEEMNYQDAIVPIKQTMQSLGYKGEYDPTIVEGYVFTKDFADGVMEITLTSLYDDEQKFTFTAAYFPKINQSKFFGLLKKQAIDYKNGKIVSDEVEHVDLGTGMFSLDEPGVENLIKKMVSKVESKANTKGTEEIKEMEEGKKQLAFVIPCPDCYDIEEEAEYFQHLLDKAGVKAKVKANQVGEEAEVYTKDEKKARKVIEKNGYQIGWNDEVEDNGEGEPTQSDDQEQSHYLDIPTGPDKGWKNEDNLKEMGGVKSIGDAGKMATPNSRPNLARHRSSDMLDKMSKKDHKTNTVAGAKAAAYKAPHMKEDKFKSFGDPDLTLNDLNKDIVITPFELEKTWKDVYGEDFKTEYSGVHSYLTKNYKNFTIVDLVDVWERMYGEDFLYEYSGISKWLFSNQGKTSSKDKVAPKMNEDVNEIGGHGDAPDSPKLQAAAKYLVQNRDKYLTQDYFFPQAISMLSLKSDKDLYDYIVNNWHSDEMYDVLAHMKSQKEKDMYANTDPNIADPINEDDDIFAGSDTANWKNNYGNETSEWDTEIAGQTIKGWTAEETQGGAIAWQNPRYPNADIYATPGWEGVDGIALELHDSEDGFMDEPKIQKVVGSGTDLWKTKEGYMALMAKVFTTLEKMLKPSEEMAEDDGTGRQINHDFNDDISKDPSEFEDAIQEDEDPFGAIKQAFKVGDQVKLIRNNGLSTNRVGDIGVILAVDYIDVDGENRQGAAKVQVPGGPKKSIWSIFDDLKLVKGSVREDEDPFSSIKTGIDQITHDDDTDMSDDDRFDYLGGDQIKAGIESLMADGFDYREILQFVKDTIASKRNY